MDMRHFFILIFPWICTLSLKLFLSQTDKTLPVLFTAQAGKVIFALFYDFLILMIFLLCSLSYSVIFFTLSLKTSSTGRQ